MQDLLVHDAAKCLMGDEVKFAYERLCFFKQDWKSRFILTLDDLAKLKKYIVASIQKSPAIAILEILNMMSQKGKELKYLFMILHDFVSNGSVPMTSPSLFNQKNQMHIKNMQKERVHLLVNVKGQDYMWAYDSLVNEFNYRKQLFQLLLYSESDAKIIPKDIGKIINGTMEKLPQWYTDRKTMGFVDFKKVLEKAFRNGKVLVDIELQEEVKRQNYITLFHIYHVDRVYSILLKYFAKIAPFGRF